MKRILLVKTILSLFIVVIFLFLFNYLGFYGIKGYDYQESSSWTGEDIGFVPQSDVFYESHYLPFSDIIEPVGAIDETKTYVIESAYDLYMFSKLSREANKTVYLSLDYVLGRDIDYYQIVQENISYRFIPVGFLEPFTGTFDGQGYEITNLFFQSILDEEDYNNNYPGLRFFAMFSKVSSTGVIKNLGLINPIIIQPIEWGIMDHVANVAGENYGLIENVYVIDQRGTTAGLNVEGSFRISGLVSINQGTFRNSYIAAPHIKSSAVVENISTSAVSYLNLGTMENVYYDQSILVDDDTDLSLGTGLNTNDFQNDLYFSTGWYLNDHYQSLIDGNEGINLLTLDNTYPILQGLEVSDHKLLISDAVDFVYMNDLLNASGLFRDAHYEIIHDIDMNQVSSTAYQAASVAFTGILSSSLSNTSSQLYERNETQGGDILYHSILNLKITVGSEVGNFVSYGLFSSFFGTIQNVNFINYQIDTLDISDYTHKTKILVGFIAGQMNLGHIENVHIQGQIDIMNALAAIPKLNVGGLVGEGSGSIEKASIFGQLNHATQTYQLASNESSTGGFVGLSDHISIEYGYNALTITGLGFNASNTSTTYLGGFIGHGSIDHLNKLVNDNTMVSSLNTGYLDTLHAGGIIGLQTDQYNLVKHIYNHGDIDIIINQPMTLTLSGYGFVDGSQKDLESEYEFMSITNEGELRLVLPSGNIFSQTELESFNIRMAGVMVADQIDATFTGLFNVAHIDLDLSLIETYAGVLDLSNTNQSSLTQAYQTGYINLVSYQVLTNPNIKVSGIALGTHISYEHLRNEGNITIDLDHNTTVASGDLFVTGLVEEISQDQTLVNGFNGGNITVNQRLADTINYDINVSGITHQNKNTNYYQTEDINHQTIENIDGIPGSIDNVLNDGDITVIGSFVGSSRVSGIVNLNGSLLSTAINTGNVKNHHQMQLTNGEVAAAGISYLLYGPYAQIKDSANYGNIESLSLTANGYAHASGIAVRNDLNEDLSIVSSGTLNKYAKILFSINYGDIYAYNLVDETYYTITNETRSKASGIFTLGLTTIMNTINYGNVYGRYLSAGIFGFVYLNRFGTIGTEQVFIANNINYGKSRAINDYQTDYQIDMYQVPMRTSYNAFSSFIGKFHTGTATWEFLSNSSYALYPIDLIHFGYNHNFDPIANMLGNAPATTMDPNLAGGDPRGQGNILILEIIEKLSTTNLNDQSIAPFAAKELGAHPKVAIYGMAIPSYEMDDSPEGVFDPLFIFRKLPVRSSGPDQYLRNYYQYMPVEKANPELINKIEAYTTNDYMGIYVLASSESISNGIFIPDHLDLDGLHPHMISQEPDETWLGIKEDSDSVIYKLTIGMSQLEMTFGTTIYDLEIKQVDVNGNPIENGLVLRKPTIDEDRAMITYYLPSNATILNAVGSSQVSTTSFVEASEGVGYKVPDYFDTNINDWVYKWVGNYKKVGDDFIPIGPYDTNGTYQVNFTTNQYTSDYKRTNRIIDPVYTRSYVNTNISNLTYIHEHIDHTYSWTGNTGNYNYIGTGYMMTSDTEVAPGYGAYRWIPGVQTGISTIPYYVYGTYEYVGPSKELVTYVESNPTVTTVFDDAGIYFQPNLDENTYMLASGASLSYEEQTVMTSATIPLSYGIYESLYQSSTGSILDKLEYHYGSIRVFSSEYDDQNANTYKDYQIRIVRTQDQSLNDIEALSVNGFNAMPSYSDFRDVYANGDIHFEKDGDLGVLSFSYSILNIANGYDILPHLTLYDDVSNDIIDASLYTLDHGIVENNNEFNNLTGVWGIGTFIANFEVSDRLKSGSYRLTLALVTGETATIHFDKIQSSNGFILDITYQDDLVIPDGQTITSHIPFGIYYDALNEATNIVDFTNLSSISNIYEENLDELNMPSYLEGITLSPFSTLVSTDLSITMIDTYRHQYVITYIIEAEDQTTYTYEHILEEYVIDSMPISVYKDGGLLEQPYEHIQINYNGAPTIRVELDTEHVYFPNENTLGLHTSFIPLNGTDEAISGQDYFMSQIFGVGYQIDFNKQTPIGTYETFATYESSISLWGELLTWSYTFDTVSMDKLKNDESMLVNVTFVSDTVFSGFNTIVDIEEITETMYVNYLQYPETRKMSVLPTTGIYYGEYANLDQYWIIGQVQRTSLTAYTPNFVLPDGAIIRRVVDQVNISYEYQSELLTDDFEGTDGTFNYIQYRVYAHDFDENPSNYTDYYVAVQDVTNNIRFNLTVVNETAFDFEKIFVKINVCRMQDEGIPCTFNDLILSMSATAYYDALTDTYYNNQFQTTAYGIYMVFVDLPKGYTFTVEVQQVSIDGSQFYLEDSILPRKYNVTVRIIEQMYEEDWGYQEVEEYQPIEPEVIE